MAMPDPIPEVQPETPVTVPPPRKRPWLSPLNQRRWRNFKRNRRALWSLIIFCVLFGLSLLAEFIANDKPFLVYYDSEFYTPIFKAYPETTFGGVFETETDYREPLIQEKIKADGIRYIDVRPEVQDRYNEGIQKRMKHMVWSSCNSWYISDDGSNHALYPGFAAEYVLRTRNFHPHDYDIVAE